MNVSFRRGAVIATVAAAFVAGTMVVPAIATHQPANKVSASGSTTEVVAPGESVTLLSEAIKTSKPTDLILAATLECSITTNVTTVGNDEAFASGTVDVWVEIDGARVSVDGADDGSVTFCSRTYKRETLEFDDEDATIKTFLDTKTAHGFDWMVFDVGSGIHTVEVKATLSQEASGNDSTARAAVGKRTFIIEPTKAANDEAVSEI